MTRRSFIQNMLGALAMLVLPAAVKSGARKRLSPQKLYSARFGLDENPPRFTWTGKKYIRSDAPSPGGLTKVQIDEAYRDAEYCIIRVYDVSWIFA